MSFSKHSDTAPVCYTKPLDSLKHSNDSFFWVDSSVFPLSIPWHTKKTVPMDHSPTADEFSAEACNFLATHQAPFQKFSESFLCLVGISRYYDLDDNVYPTFLPDAGEEMDLFAFIHHANPTKVWIGERQIEEGQVPLLESTRGRVIPLAGEGEQGYQHVNVEDVEPRDLNEGGGDAEVGDQTEESGHVAQDEEDLLDRSTLAVELGVTAASILPFATSSVTPTPEREGGGNTHSICGSNMRTQRPSERFVISSDSSHHCSTNVADAEVSSLVSSLAPPPPVMTAAATTTNVFGASFASLLGAGTEPIHASMELFADTFYVSQDMDSETLRQIYVPKWNVVNEYVLDDHNMCCSLIDQLALPRLFSQLHGMDYDQLFADFNVGAARQTCLSDEVRMRTEHILRERKRFEGKCARQDDLLKERDVEITNLKAQLSFKEAEATEAIRLRNQVSELDSLKEQNMALEKEKTTLEGQVAMLESGSATKDTEIASLNGQTAKLAHDLSNLQSSCDELSTTCSGLHDQVKEQIKAVKDEQVRVLSDRVTGLDSELMALALHLDEELYPRFLTTIAGRRWILSRGLRLAVMSIDHGKAERGLADVAAYDPSVEAKYGPSAETPEASQLQPSYEQLLLHVHRKEDNVVTRETSLSDSLDLVHICVQTIKEDDLSHHSSISDVIGVLVDPLSFENLIGKASTSRVPATAIPATTLVVANVSSTAPTSVIDYGVLDAEPQPEASHSPKVVFEKKTWTLHLITLQPVEPSIHYGASC
nr:transposase (putative), gypsy type [Tanacetum cinerariifolium]